MFRNASWGAIGVNVGFQEGLALAQRVGFEGVDTSLDQVAALGATAYRDLLASHGLVSGPWGVPVNWQGEATSFEDGLAGLPALAATAQSVGATRCCTWVPSWSDSRELEANWEFHVERFGAIARVLADHGCRLGLEFLGPKTLRDGHAHDFVHTCGAMVELCRAIGPNAGLLLDAWHWHTAGGTVAELAALSNADVVFVHVNDAPPGIALDEQRDNVRCVPGDTGVIDLAAFMQQLGRMAYDGPVTVEPFNQALAQTPNVAAAYRVKASLDFLFSLA